MERISVQIVKEAYVLFNVESARAKRRALRLKMKAGPCTASVIDVDLRMMYEEAVSRFERYILNVARAKIMRICDEYGE